MTPAAEDRLLGDYRLRQEIERNALRVTWLAEQVSVGRLVLVDELLAQDGRDNFLADVRAKAAIDHPLIGSVYEAVAEPDCCFYAHELLAGPNLTERANAGETFLPARLAHILRRTAEAQIQHETLDHATSPMGLDAVHIDEHGVIRLTNLAVAGHRADEQSTRDVVHFGKALPQLIAPQQAGTTRMLTLLSWMRGEGLDAPLTWSQVRDFCLQIEHQLADPLSIVKPTGQVSLVTKKPVTTTVVVTLLVLAGIIFLAMRLRPPEPAPPKRVSLPEAVTIPAGNYPTPDGERQEFAAFQISAHEVTIGQYAEFLDRLATLAANGHETIFDAPNQPKDKTSHAPDDWAELFATAKANGIWHDLPVTLDSPVTGVDWWDAIAYVEWKKGRLPTQEEWHAALSYQVENPAGLAPGTWAPVTDATPDQTPAGMRGMAGSVSEWTGGQSPNPANPLGGKLHVIIGGSYLKPSSNALSREWIAEASLRRPDLGFRVIVEEE
ncbi:MAG: SUMF1/EgtB/PvdO family nonheme iron enzyme [Verrucomicrobiota bacterium]